MNAYTILTKIRERIRGISGERPLIDSLALVAPALVLALALSLPMPWEFYEVIFYYFFALLAVLLGVGVFKKWYTRSWFFFWIGTAALYISLYISSLYRYGPKDIFNEIYSYLKYDSKCESICYFPLSPVMSAGIVLIFGLLVLLAKKAFPRFFSQIFFAALSFWAYFLIIMPPLYKILADISMGTNFGESLMTVPRSISISLALMAIFILAVAGRPLQQRILPCFAFFALLFLFVNIPTLQHMKHHVGYSFLWPEIHSGNGENLLVLLRHYADIFWVRPAFYSGILLLGILLFVLFLRAGKQIGRWQKNFKKRRWLGRFLAEFVFLSLKIACWASAAFSLAYMAGGVFIHRISLNQLDEVLVGSIIQIGNAKENLRFFILFLVGVVIAGIVSALSILRSKRSGPKHERFPIARPRSRILEIACGLIVVFVVAFTCTGFTVTVVDWQMFQAVKTGDFTAFKNALEKGADPRVKVSGQSLLHVAAKSASPEILEYLLNRGLDPNEKDRGGITPLAWLSENPCYIGEEEKKQRAVKMRCAVMLLEKGADVNVKQRMGDLLLHDLAECHDTAWLELILQNTPDKNKLKTALDQGDWQQCTVLHRAVMANNRAATALLLRHGADCERRDKDGLKPIDYARKEKQTELVQLLETACGNRL